jgi:hypothetical protein
MAFKFELKLPNGDDAGTLVSNEWNWRPGDEIRAHGNKRYRITAVVPLPVIGEFVDGATYALLEVEPLP